MALPSREEMHQEALRRIQLGVAGLGGVLLLVGLTNVVIANIRKESALDSAQSGQSAGTVANATDSGQPSEPLADLGVTPAPDSRSGTAMPAVPDLEPDPRLQKPMDRDPRQNR